jgi:HEPN domain-containing protein
MKSKSDYVRDWFLKAASDLKIATREMQAVDPASDAVCFHFQQAVEKILKAWLAWRDVPPKPVHNIEVLLSLCEETDPEFATLRRAELLTAYAVEIRYPDNAYFPTTEEMQEAAGIAKQIREFVLARLRKEGLSLVDAPGNRDRTEEGGPNPS